MGARIEVRLAANSGAGGIIEITFLEAGAEAYAFTFG